MNFLTPVTLLTPAVPAAAVPHQPAPRQALNLIHAVLETVMGRRSLHQLRPHLRADAFDNLVDYADSGAFKRVRLGSVRSQMPTPRAVEASVTLSAHGRSVSCVLRLDAARGAWRCSDLVILCPAGMLSQRSAVTAAAA